MACAPCQSMRLSAASPPSPPSPPMPPPRPPTFGAHRQRGRLSKYDTVLYVRLALCWTAKNCTAKAWRTGLRHCLVLATATPTLAALRPAHDHARAEHTRHARTTRARLASDAHAFTLQQALARQKQGWHARVTGHWLTVGLPTACASGSHTRCKCARHLRCSCGACVTHTLCMPCTTTVVTCAETW